MTTPNLVQFGLTEEKLWGTPQVENVLNRPVEVGLTK